MPVPAEHVLWRTGEFVSKLTLAHRHNGQTCLILHEDGSTERVVTDHLQTIKEYF